MSRIGSEALQFAEEPDDEVDPDTDYVPEPRVIWAAEAMRATLVVLTRRLGPDFARDVHNEIFSRTVAYHEGCPDDQRDANVLDTLLKSEFWDVLFALETPARKG